MGAVRFVPERVWLSAVAVRFLDRAQGRFLDREQHDTDMKLQLTLARVASRTCFAGLPPHVSEALLDQHADALGAGGALEVSWQQSGSARSALMTWAGGSSASQSCLELSNAMCDAMGLVEGTELTVTVRKQLPVVSRIFVEPLCSDDWEIIQLHAGLLEEQVLNQVRAVSDGMTLPLWISASSMVRLKVKSLHVGDSSTSAGLLAQNSEVVVAPLERKVVGVAQFDDDCQMLRVLALEHLLASRSRNAEDNRMLPTFGEVMLPSEEARGRCTRVGSDGEAESAAHRRDGQEIEAGRCGDGDSQNNVARERPRKFRAGLHLFRGVDGDGAVVPISSGDESAAGGKGRGTMGRRVRMAVSRARPDAIVPRQHVLLSRVMRLQLDAAIGSWIAVSRLRTATSRGVDEAGTPGVTGSANSENVPESQEEEEVLTPAKICIQRVLLTGAVASESGGGGERARLGSSPELKDNSSQQENQDGGQVRGRARGYGGLPLKELLLEWLAVNAPVKKRRLCVSDSVLLALPHDAQHAAGDAEIDGSACSKNSTLVCLSFRQGNDHVYAAGSSVCYFGLWLQGVTEAVVEEGADVHWGEWTEHVSLSPTLSDVEPLGEVTSRVISHVHVGLLSERRRAKLIGSSFGAPGSLLIYGSPGCGKTLLCRALAHMVSAEWARKCGGVDGAVGRVGGGRCYAEVVACREMGRSGEQRAVAVMSSLEAAFERARRRAPALLVLDDIDVVAPAISSQGQGEVGADASARIRAQGQLLIDMMRELGASKKRVAVVATTKTLASVNVKTLAGGLFDAQIEIPAPDRHARVAILRRMLQAAPVSPSPLLDVSVLIHELDGFTPHDLNTLAIRAAAAAAARALESPSDSTSPINMTEADLKSARRGFVPPALRGAQAREKVPWESVAGMKEAKDTLLQLVLLPTKYPDIFATAPLRVRSGALLLGYPGCGKTMLVAALASKTGLNFISVKGPELLNKYIGQSGDEQRCRVRVAVEAERMATNFDATVLCFRARRARRVYASKRGEALYPLFR